MARLAAICRATRRPDVDRRRARITLVLEDKRNQFLPVIVKMSVEEAERLRDALSEMIASKKRGDTV